MSSKVVQSSLQVLKAEKHSEERFSAFLFCSGSEARSTGMHECASLNTLASGKKSRIKSKRTQTTTKIMTTKTIKMIKNKCFFIFYFLHCSQCLCAQTYTFKSPPLNGECILKSQTKIGVFDPTPGISISSDSQIVYASGRGKVIFCKAYDVKGYLLGIKYKKYIWMYGSLDTLYLEANQNVCYRQKLGRVLCDSSIGRYYLNLQIFRNNKILSPNKTIQFIGGKVEKGD